MPKLKELYAYSTLQLHTTNLKKVEKERTPCLPIKNNSVLVGIEVEAENIKQIPIFNNYWECKNDGSLRNNGKEFVSHPIKGHSIEYALLDLKKTIGEFADFSPRTSVHVHMNVRELTPEEIYIFCLLYCLFEKHFFKLADNTRERSLFCVPLYLTSLVRNLQTTINEFYPENWHKYAALNILPIMHNSVTGCYGTIEFRHLEGNLDVPRIVQFINGMLCLYEYSKKITLPELLDFIRSANSTSGYVEMYNNIFGEFTTNMNQEDFEECITSTKQNLYWNIGEQIIDLVNRRSRSISRKSPTY